MSNFNKILKRCGYEHGKDQVILECLNLKVENESKPKSVGKFVMHKKNNEFANKGILDRSSPNIDLLESPDYIQYSSLGIHKDHRGLTK